MAKTPQVVDFGDQFPDTSNSFTDDDIVVIKGLWGKDFRFLKGVNLFSALHSEADPSELPAMLANAVHPEDRKEFASTIRAQRSLMDGEEFGRILNAIIGAVAGNPQTSSGASSRTTTKRAAG